MSNLVYEYGLQAFFFEKLKEINKRQLRPLPEESLYYSSLVMDKFGISENYFEMQDGLLKEKLLGKKFLEASQFSGSKQRKIIKDVGDTSLFLCGYFCESLNSKIVDLKYYSDLGQIAYKKLNTLVPNVYNIPLFFQEFSESFIVLSSMMTMIHQESREEIEKNNPLIYVFDKSEDEKKAS